MPDHTFVIGLTGNIATGKSLVGRVLSRLGAKHIDADRLAHQVMAPGTRAWEEIVETFGTQVLQPGGEIDRHKLGTIVFSESDALARLEAIVHPKVIARTRQLISVLKVPVVVIEAIKLIESGMADELCDAVWVVTASREVQLERLMEQRQLSYADAVLRIDAQPPQGTKTAQADVVIDNGGSVEATVHQVEQAWAKLSLCDRSSSAAVRNERNIRWT